MTCLELFLGFLRVGCFAFGGAYGAIPLIREVVLSYGWLDDEALAYMIAVSESTPGPIMVNLATYVGSSQAGFVGALAATVAVTLPAFAVILFIMAVLQGVLKSRWSQVVLRGLKPCIAGIVLATGAYLTMTSCLPANGGSPADLRGLALAAVLAAMMPAARRLLHKKLSPVALILLAACLGMVVYQ